MERISESELILPALWCIEKNNQILSTTDLIQCLRDLLHPTGEDLSILEGRNDDKFSQKVRNLVSHKTLEKSGLAKHESISNVGHLALTDEGNLFLQQNRYLMEYLRAGEFSYNDTKETLNKVETPIKEGSQATKKLMVFDENMVISEGRVICLACQFDFEAVYGDLGKGFIEVHHTKPIVVYEDDDLEKQITDALTNVLPLCANCHRMVHRRKGYVLPLQELSDIINQQRNTDTNYQRA